MYGKFGCGVTHEQAVEEFNGGKTVVQIARKYGITTKEVKTILREGETEKKKEEKKAAKPQHGVVCSRAHCEWGNNTYGICCLPCCMKNKVHRT